MALLSQEFHSIPSAKSCVTQSNLSPSPKKLSSLNTASSSPSPHAAMRGFRGAGSVRLDVRGVVRALTFDTASTRRSPLVKGASRTAGRRLRHARVNDITAPQARQSFQTKTALRARPPNAPASTDAPAQYRAQYSPAPVKHLRRMKAVLPSGIEPRIMIERAVERSSTRAESTSWRAGASATIREGDAHVVGRGERFDWGWGGGGEGVLGAATRYRD
ncbi:hypothetical protein B0H11DRAFT_2217916 [Mycena galericulata]|nr:hypothetical protein B0H11DRAFT_2217916 [Mycena galericulata]